MKKAIFFFAFAFVLGAAGVNAQSCQSAGKSCCANKVAKAAASDPSIEQRKADDGSVAYVRKQTDAKGNVQFVSVQYDEAANAFVNVAPQATVTDNMVKKTASCSASSSASEGKSCAGASAGKACCAKGGSEGKACCAKKAEQ